MPQLSDTLDYDIFKSHEANRKKDEKHVNRLVEEIRENNKLAARPILVGKGNVVIDGQHRLEAAKRLNLPVYYIVDETADIKDIKSINTNTKTWTIGDYLNYYAQQCYPEYIDLQAFVEKEKMPLNVALQLLNAGRATSFFKEFKEGHYQFPKGEDFAEAMIKKCQISHVIAHIKKSTTGPKTYLDRVTFYDAMVNFFNIKMFNYDTFLNKLSYRIDLIHPCARRCEYMKMFKSIYNWKNQDPIKLDDFE